MESEGVATRLVRRRIEGRLSSPRVYAAPTNTNTLSPLNAPYVDLNVWRLVMQGLCARDKLAFMQTHKIAWKVGDHGLAWKHLCQSFRGKLQHQISYFFSYITQLQIDMYNPTFSLLIG